MPFTLTCPECGHEQTVPDEVAGRKVRCKNCQAVFRAGSVDVDVVVDEPPARRRPADRDDRPRRRSEDEDRPRSRRPDDDEDDRPARRRADRDDSPKRSGQASRSRLPLALGLVGLVVLLGGGLAAYLLFFRTTPTDYADPEGLFTARFPGKPSHRVVTVNSPSTHQTGEREAKARAGGLEYTVTVFGPFGSPAPDARWRDSQLKTWAQVTAINAEGQTVDERAASHEGHAATDLVVLIRGEGRGLVARLLAGEKYVLRMSVAGDASDPEAAKGLREKAVKFFEAVHVGPAFGPPLGGVSAPPDRPSGPGGPAANTPKPKESGPPVLTAGQRKILGKWKTTRLTTPRVWEFKADGEFIEMEEQPDGTRKRKDERRQTFRFLDEKTFVETVAGLDLFTYEIVTLDDTRLSVINTRIGGGEQEYTRVE